MLFLPSLPFPAVARACVLATYASTCLLFNLNDPQPSYAASTTTTDGYGGYDVVTQRLKSCPAKSNCVSSTYMEPPNRYVSPLEITDREIAFERAVRDVTTNSNVGNQNQNTKVLPFAVADIVPKNYYIHLTTPGTAPGSLDDIELVFTDGDIVNVRCEARVTLPPPPFCIQKNCINGNMDQRRRLEGVSSAVLGLQGADQQRMMDTAKWSPIFFNSDRVPTGVEYDDF
uniref:Uncharacterized protein n=1 Tax=Proboscia inermis TaxID=420281 RepID=A0A6T8H401_9STRA|mmetsp:Transcript_19275/g.19555  ORF Transcript_19275/g.19555 Transcript_19275/m.19555 type:complete len:229 (+) Transcript_19275:69-755(+)